MLELLGLVGVVLVGGLVIAAAALVIGLLKLVLKLLTLPFVLGWALLKFVLGAIAVLVGLAVLGPIVLAVGLVLLLPVIFLIGVVKAIVPA
jgi:hypothetical protein